MAYTYIVEKNVKATAKEQGKSVDKTFLDTFDVEVNKLLNTMLTTAPNRRNYKRTTEATQN